MASLRKFSFVLPLFVSGAWAGAALDIRQTPDNATHPCIEISRKISDASEVIYANNLNFGPDINHFFLSSTQFPDCVLETGSDEDTATALEIIGRTRTPFAVKSGGHASQPGFSSTEGVHISLKRLDQVSLSGDKSTVDIGAGLTWPDVYDQLEGSGVNVVGGRVPGPGVGGFTLGGGFSWKSNQYGLTCDTVESFNLVLPNGTITTVDSSKSDLFFALKGGLNRFGIVTSMKFKTHPQPPQIFGGFNVYRPDETSRIIDATYEFDRSNTDPKAQIITTLETTPLGPVALVLFFYDGPEQPESFEPFNKIIPLTILQGVRTQSFSSFVSSVPSGVAELANFRGTFETLSTTRLTSKFLKAVQEESKNFADEMVLHGGTFVSFDIEPFGDFGQFATESAYPHANSPLPLNLYFSWTSALQDEFWYNAMKASVARLKELAIKEGIYDDSLTKYPNYAIKGTTSEELYGAENAARLSEIKDSVDPEGVMELAGGFAI